jgi:formylglycine-generating enzyme required for sulfatase activity
VYLASNGGAPKPAYWGDRHYNQPVVGVSWKEAAQRIAEDVGPLPKGPIEAPLLDPDG